MQQSGPTTFVSPAHCRIAFPGLSRACATGYHPTTLFQNWDVKSEKVHVSEELVKFWGERPTIRGEMGNRCPNPWLD
jgi:hypothetical protein